MEGWKDGRIQKDRGLGGRIESLNDGRVEGWMEGWKDGRIEDWVEGWKDHGRIEG